MGFNLIRIARTATVQQFLIARNDEDEQPKNQPCLVDKRSI